MPSVNHFSQSAHYVGVLISYIDVFVRIIFQIIELGWNLIPDVSVLIFCRVFTLETQEQLPITFDTPEVLQGAVGAVWSHVVD